MRTKPKSKNGKKKTELIKNREYIPSQLRGQPQLHRYWHQRFQLFSRFNAGIKLDNESWFSVTPEVIARHVAERCSMVGGVILDAFCGCGGNTIQFARHCSRVIAIDIDPVKIQYCKNNARIYGVEDKIEFLVGDFMDLASSLRADMVFLSPPWGGPSYSKAETFDLEIMPINGLKLFQLAQNISGDIAYFLPKNVDREQITKLAGIGNYVDIETNLYKGRVKAITAYYGSLVKK